MYYKYNSGNDIITSFQEIERKLFDGKRIIFDRIMIIGSPGSGKTYLCNLLKNYTSLPIIHLDTLFWNPDRTHISYDELYTKIAEIVKQKTWLIDGNYTSSMEVRINEVQLVIYLDFSTEQCVEGVKSRVGSNRDEMPWDNDELDDSFLEYVKSFRHTVRFEIERLLKKYPEKNVLCLHSRAEFNELLESFQKA